MVWAFESEEDPTRTQVRSKAKPIPIPTPTPTPSPNQAIARVPLTGQIFSKAFCAALKSLRTPLSYSPYCLSLGESAQRSEHASGWSTTASLLAPPGFMMCGMKAALKAAATPMRTSARKLEAPFFAYIG